MKIVSDTLMVKGKWSQKRLQAFSCFWFTILYIFMPVFIPAFDVKEFVVCALLGLGGFTIFRLQKNNENNINTDTQ